MSQKTADFSYITLTKNFYILLLSLLDVYNLYI